MTCGCEDKGDAPFQGFLGATLVALMLGIVFLVIGFGTPFWASREVSPVLELHTGLWETCQCVKIDQDSAEAWFRSVQVLSALGLFFLIVMVTVLLMVLCVPVFNRYVLIIVFICVAVLTTTILIVTMVVAGVKFAEMADSELNYSYAFLVVAGVFTLVATIFPMFFLCQMNASAKQSSEELSESPSDAEAKAAEAAEAGEEI